MQWLGKDGGGLIQGLGFTDRCVIWYWVLWYGEQHIVKELSIHESYSRHHFTDLTDPKREK